MWAVLQPPTQAGPPGSSPLSIYPTPTQSHTIAPGTDKLSASGRQQCHRCAVSHGRQRLGLFALRHPVVLWPQEPYAAVFAKIRITQARVSGWQPRAGGICPASLALPAPQQGWGCPLPALGASPPGTGGGQEGRAPSRPVRVRRGRKRGRASTCPELGQSFITTPPRLSRSPIKSPGGAAAATALPATAFLSSPLHHLLFFISSSSSQRHEGDGRQPPAGPQSAALPR